jgi:hypothetical protein
MARLYEELKLRIKNVITVQEFPSSWEELINLSSKLDDNFRRRNAENKG